MENQGDYIDPEEHAYLNLWYAIQGVYTRFQGMEFEEFKDEIDKLVLGDKNESTTKQFKGF